jgi:SDR family mycofactocin-dependent oxidoreductase
MEDNMGRLENKVALITGAARGQGRSHALRLAQEGADIIAIDICAPIESAPYETSTVDDLAETVKLVEEEDRRILAREADVRDLAALEAIVAEAVSEFGGIDIVSANAGICSTGAAWELSEEHWQEMIDINLTGSWKITKAVIPSMIERGQGGSIALTSSVCGVAGIANLAHYSAAKHGIVGLMRTLAVELAPHNIRCNSIMPTTVNTKMLNNPALYGVFFPQVENPSQEDAEGAFIHLNALRVPWVEPVDISNALLYLASDEARYVTGTTHFVDAGSHAAYKIPHAV